MNASAEAAKLWQEIRILESHPCKTDEDFAWKKREMEKLRAAYSRATGMPCDPSSLRENEAKGNAQLFGSMLGRDVPVTRDDLNDSDLQSRG